MKQLVNISHAKNVERNKKGILVKVSMNQHTNKTRSEAVVPLTSKKSLLMHGELHSSPDNNADAF